LANLVNDLGDLGVGRSGSGTLCFRRLPSPAGCPLRQICGGGKAQRGSGRTDELPAASGCGLSGNQHDGVRKRYGGKDKRGIDNRAAAGRTIATAINNNRQSAKKSRSFGAGKSSAGHVPDPLIRAGLQEQNKND